MANPSFSKYYPLRMSLDPGGLYLPSSIADFSIEHEIIEIIHPGEGSKLARQRIRIASALFARTNQFPNEPDGKWVKETGGVAFDAYFGWRWQKFSSIEEGNKAFAARIKPILDEMKPGAHYQMEDLLEIWEGLPLGPPPNRFKRCRTGDLASSWKSIQRVIVSHTLTHFAKARGIRPDRIYDAESWRGDAHG